MFFYYLEYICNLGLCWWLKSMWQTNTKFDVLLWFIAETPIDKFIIMSVRQFRLKKNFREIYERTNKRLNEIPAKEQNSLSRTRWNFTIPNEYLPLMKRTKFHYFLIYAVKKLFILHIWKKRLYANIHQEIQDIFNIILTNHTLFIYFIVKFKVQMIRQ